MNDGACFLISLYSFRWGLTWLALELETGVTFLGIDYVNREIPQRHVNAHIHVVLNIKLIIMRLEALMSFKLNLSLCHVKQCHTEVCE